MIITKYEHACLELEEQGSKLIVDPGQFSPSLEASENIVAIVVTHSHGDHIDEDKVKNLLAKNPDAKIFSVKEVADAHTSLPVTVVGPGEIQQAGPFTLEFYGGNHAVIYPTMPQIQNVGVMVNNTLYYPGDSFAQPGKAVKVLAAPASAPWMKISEGMDFISTVKPSIAFPTHDAILSDEGKYVNDSMLSHAAEQAGVEYRRIGIGEKLEV